MASGIRIKLDPIGEEPGLVTGLQLSLERFGSGLSQAVADSATPAKITFRATLLDKARADRTTSDERLATLEGEIQLQGPTRDPVFTVPAGSADTALTLVDDATTEPDASANGSDDSGADSDSDEPDEPPPPPRVLDLVFDADSFTGTEELASPRLLMRDSLFNGFRFMELEAELEIAGATEADFDKNDVLDVRVTADSPPPLPVYDIFVVDDAGEPLDGVDLIVTFDDEDHPVTTDSKGFVRVMPNEAGNATVTAADLDGLRERMRPIWDKADRGTTDRLPPAEEDTSVFVLHGDEPTAFIDTSAPHTIRVQPYVFLARLTGMFFDLGKTFLLPTALGGLKDIRSIYNQNNPSSLLIVGHTDTSGSPSTNDPLSLDRAKSVKAYLSDDVGAWKAQFSSSVPQQQRWGKHEDVLMIDALPRAP